MDIAKDAEAGDETLTFGDVRVFVQDAVSQILPEGAIDYADDSGFVISGMPETSCC